MTGFRFEMDERLGIRLPILEYEWNEYSAAVRSAILYEWEQIRAAIPDRIRELEREIVHKQSRVDEEDNFEESCRLTYEIAELASRINDLNLWYRVDQDIDAKRHM